MTMLPRLAAAAVIGVARGGRRVLSHPTGPACGRPARTEPIRQRVPCRLEHGGRHGRGTDRLRRHAPARWPRLRGRRAEPGRTSPLPRSSIRPTGTWSSAGTMSRGRNFPTATGPRQRQGARPRRHRFVDGRWDRRRPVRPGDELLGHYRRDDRTHEASMSAALLADGRVLVAGGNADDGRVVGTAELYDPATGTWTATGNMTMWRASPSITRLDDGRVLVTGGFSADGRSAELYDPSTGKWMATGLHGRSPRWRWSDGHKARRRKGPCDRAVGRTPSCSIRPPERGHQPARWPTRWEARQRPP